MLMKPRLRKLSFTLHVAGSTGWMGAVAAYLALAIAALNSGNDALARGAYLSMDLLGRFVILPLSFAALLSGLIQALGTEWGLFRHYWVAVKFFLTIIATAVLLGHLPKVTQMAQVAAQTALPLGDFVPLRSQLLLHASGGLAVLLAILFISIYKPWGPSPYGRRQALARPQAAPELREAAARSWIYYAGLAAAGVLLFLVLYHVAGGGIPQH